MDIRELRYFLAVARENSITLAAESLNITQPGLSKVIMNMEEELGKKLFKRENRKIALTEDGIFLRKRAQEIVDLFDKTQSEFQENMEGLSGDIYIGGGETKGMKIIARVIKNMQKEYPNVHFHLFSGNSDDVIERLDKGLLDFGVLIDPVNIKNYDYLKLPTTDKWGLLMKKDSHLANRDFITVEDLINLPLICSRQSLVKNQVSSWLGTNISFESLNIVATYNLLFNASLLVKEGVGYVLCLDKLLDRSSDLCFIPLKPTLSANLNFVWKKYQIFAPATKMFLDELQKEINIEK